MRLKHCNVKTLILENAPRTIVISTRKAVNMKRQQRLEKSCSHIWHVFTPQGNCESFKHTLFVCLTQCKTKLLLQSCLIRISHIKNTQINLTKSWPGCSFYRPDVDVRRWLFFFLPLSLCSYSYNNAPSNNFNFNSTIFVQTFTLLVALIF